MVFDQMMNTCVRCRGAHQATHLQALTCADVVCGVLYGGHVEHGNHNGLLAAAYGAACPFVGTKGSDRQHPCGSMLPFPLLLSVSASLSKFRKEAWYRLPRWLVGTICGVALNATYLV